MALESWILAVKWCVLMLKLCNSRSVQVLYDTLEYLIIWLLSDPSCLRKCKQKETLKLELYLFLFSGKFTNADICYSQWHWKSFLEMDVITCQHFPGKFATKYISDSWLLPLLQLTAHSSQLLDRRGQPMWSKGQACCPV